jgi:hypothetical protein
VAVAFAIAEVSEGREASLRGAQARAHSSKAVARQ